VSQEQERLLRSIDEGLHHIHDQLVDVNAKLDNLIAGIADVTNALTRSGPKA
jgi:hypothetical protein